MTKEEIIQLVKEMISGWDTVKTYAAICKRDALKELLRNILDKEKEQEPMKLIYSEEKFGDFLPHCPACKKVLPSVSQYGKSNFCHRCGQAVK